MYRYFTEPRYRQWLVWISGVVQTALYAGALRWGRGGAGEGLQMLGQAWLVGGRCGAMKLALGCYRSAAVVCWSWVHCCCSVVALGLPTCSPTPPPADFFYFYVKAWKHNTRLQLPA